MNHGKLRIAWSVKFQKDQGPLSIDTCLLVLDSGDSPPRIKPWTRPRKAVHVDSLVAPGCLFSQIVVIVTGGYCIPSLVNCRINPYQSTTTFGEAFADSAEIQSFKFYFNHFQSTDLQVRVPLLEDGYVRMPRWNWASHDKSLGRNSSVFVSLLERPVEWSGAGWFAGVVEFAGLGLLVGWVVMRFLCRILD